MLSLASSAHGAQIKAELPGETPRVAESFWLTVTVAAEENETVVFPAVTDAMGDFQVLSHRDWFDVPVGQQRTWTRNFELRSFVGGELEIPPVQAAVNGRTIATKTIPLTISSSVEANASPAAFRDIKQQIEIPAEPEIQSSRWTTWIVGGSLLGVCIAFATWLAFRKRKVAADTWALAQLEQLRSTPAYSENDAVSLTPKIADVLREYIERKFAIEATRQTTEEFLRSQSAGSNPFSTPQLGVLQEFLEHADQVKFAAHTPDRDGAPKSMQLVEDFVRATGEGK